MRHRPWLIITLGALLVSACSVSTPRNESAAVRTGATGGPGDTTAPDGTVLADGSVAPDGTVLEGGSTDPDAGTTLSDGSSEGGASGGGGDSSEGAGAAGATASAGGPVPGVTKDTITLSVVAGFSGVLAPLVNKAYEAMLTWQEDVNAAGGIHGRRIVLKPVDHKETAAGGVAACKEVQSNGSFVAAVPEGVEANVTAVDCLDASGIPTIYYAAVADPSWKRAFADVITSAQGGTIMASYVRSVLGGAGKKIGVMYVNQAAYKEVSDTFVPEAKKLGLTVASVQSVEPNQASFTSQLLKMQQAGVQILVVSATAEAIGIIRDARSMGYQVQITGWGYMFDFVTQAGRSMFDGVTGLRPYATVDSPAYATYAARMKARGRARDDRTTDLEGFVTYGRALLYGEMLRRAGTDPTRESFVAGAETITGFETGIVPPISYSASDHIGASSAFPVVCCNSDYTWKSQGAARAEF
jgi:branched-chain amino acid transport system substrate-binding protein